ncbi:hypothetical protein EZS27_041490 [termite gut metagenome]|uniref:Arm DNA-binding domain-containing protein n=1 Tax=termite gut metagenome TaxID=433724 RepID=A0A5J4PBT9_9ZZZZ
MNTELKVSFYLKREQSNRKVTANFNPAYPIVGKIIIGKTIAQFSTKLKVEERLWHVKSGRVAGKSHAVTSLNREINKINLILNRYHNIFLIHLNRVILLTVSKFKDNLFNSAIKCLSTSHKEWNV